MPVLVAVTDHAVERFRQRVATRRGDVDTRVEIASRVANAVAAGRSTGDPPPGAEGTPGSVYVRDLVDRDVVFVCRPADGELLVVTLWEEPRAGRSPRVPRRFTDALRDDA